MNKMVIVAVVIFLLAGVVLALGMGWFNTPPGKGVGVELRCKKCNNTQTFDMAYVIGHGGWNDAQTGWHMRCPKCKEPAPLKTPAAWEEQAKAGPKREAGEE